MLGLQRQLCSVEVKQKSSTHTDSGGYPDSVYTNKMAGTKVAGGKTNSCLVGGSITDSFYFVMEPYMKLE
jgi:hypothetical protein